MLKRSRTWRGRTGRASPDGVARSTRRPARALLLLLALAALGLEGCQSDPCAPRPRLFGNCRLLQGCRNPFRRDVVVSDACGEPALGIPVESAPVITTPTQVAPGPPVELEPVTPAPAAEELSPAPTTGSTAPNQKTIYETYKPSGGTPLSRRDGGGSGALAAPLADLPPITAPIGAADSTVTPPVATPAQAERPAGPDPSRAAAELPPKPTSTGPVSLAEGIARFKVLDPQLAGGSLPTEAGWKFLAEEKGYKTVIDLRPRDEARAGDDAIASNLGLRYLVLPLTPAHLDRAFLDRFETEIQQNGNRPLYVFDTDGSRPAIVWYLRQILIEKRDESSAKQEVEELGPVDTKWWLAASTLLEKERSKAAASPAAPTVPSVPASTEPAPAPATVPAPAPAAAPATPAPDTGAAPQPPADSATPELTLLPDEPDPTTWQPLAAMAFTGLGMRLAYVSQKVIRNHWPRRQLASLPAPEHSPRSLPGASGG